MASMKRKKRPLLCVSSYINRFRSDAAATRRVVRANLAVHRH
jgi:hypothetical protein